MTTPSKNPLHSDVSATTVWAKSLGFFVVHLWRLVGLLALPLLWLHPRARHHVRNLPAPNPGWIWLHGASAGEHRAAQGLMTALPQTVWCTRSSWRTPVPNTFPAPLDLPFVLGPWLDRARPSQVILIEAELWPGWLHACRVRGIPVTVVNARDSRGTARLRRLPSLWQGLTQGVTFISQHETGDLKLAAPAVHPAFSLNRTTFIAASTRSGDERRVLEAWATLPTPRPLLLIAPRHLERVDEVHKLACTLGWSVSLRSVSIDTTADVLLLDTQGELAGLFGMAAAAFMGGTFTPALGGHSPAEPFAAGLPVVHGPCTHANPEAWTAGTAISGADDLSAAIGEALNMGRSPPRPTQAAQAVAARLPKGRIPPPRPARPWLAPLTPLWLAIGRRIPAYRDPPVQLDVPVVSVGGLSAGGTGKTPAVAWLAERLPGAWVVARGYRRPPGPGVRMAGALGDELEMLHRRGIPVVSAPDRVAGAKAAIAQGATLIILDDGFQHRRLARDLDIVCMDGRWPGSRGLIPVGSQREPFSALQRAHWLWHTHADYPMALPHSLPTVHARYRPVGWIHRGERLPLDALPPGLHPVATGIARAEGFLSALVLLGVGIRSCRLVRDHGALTHLEPGTVMTEKDAARLPEDADVWALCIALDVEDGEPLLQAIRSLQC